MTVPQAPGALVAYDYGEDVGKGYEGQTKADMAIPFINQLQALSPLVAAEKAKQGDYLNTVTQEVISRDSGFHFVVGGTRRAYVEWVPRNNPDGTPRQVEGSSYRGEHAVESDVVAKALREAGPRSFKLYTPEGNSLRDTRYVYGCFCSPTGENTMAIMPFWSTKIKPFQLWMTRMRQFTAKDADGKTIVGPDGKPVKPPIFAHLNKITSIQTQNTQKQMYFIPVIAPADPRGMPWSMLPQSDERYQIAKECKLLFESGAAQVDYSRQADGDAADEDDSTTGSPFGT